MRRTALVPFLALLSLTAAPLAYAAQEPDRPTRRTPAGWRVQPAGEEIGVSQAVAGFQGPTGSVLSPDGSQLLSVSSGAARIQSVDVFDLEQRMRTGFVSYDATKGVGESVFYGVVYSPDGNRAWAAGGGQNVVHAYTVGDDGKLTETGTIATPFFPAGIAYGMREAGFDGHLVPSSSWVEESVCRCLDQGSIRPSSGSAPSGPCWLPGVRSRRSPQISASVRSRCAAGCVRRRPMPVSASSS